MLFDISSILPNIRNNSITSLDLFKERLAKAKDFQSVATLTEPGHNRIVRALTVLLDGRIVSGSEDNRLRLWNVNTRKCLATLKGHTHFISALAVLPDGRIVSGSFDNTLRIWNANSYQCLATLNGHTETVYALAVLPDGRIVSGSKDKTLSIWDASTQQCLAILRGHTDSVEALAVLPDGRIVSGSSDRTIRIWDATTYKCLATLKGASYVTALAVLPDGRIVSSSSDNTLRLWDANTWECLATWQTESIISLLLLPDGRLVSGSTGGTLRIWDTSTHQCITTLKEHHNRVLALVALPDGRMASSSYDNTLRIWEGGMPVLSLADFNHIITALKTNTSIKSLSFARSNLTFVQIQALADLLKINSSIISLDLSDTAITDAGVQVIIKALNVNQSLIELNLSGNAIGDEYKKTIDDLLLVRNQKPAHNPLAIPAPLLPAKMEIPEHLVCPLTQQIMFDPVIASDGHTYEREAIQAWIAKAESKNKQATISKLASAAADYVDLNQNKPKPASPMTNLAFEHTFLVPNHSIKGLVSDFLDKLPILRESDDYYLPQQTLDATARALTAGDAKTLKQLLQRDKRIIIRYQHNDESLLEAACHQGSLETLELVLSALPAEVANQLDAATKYRTFQVLLQTHGIEGARLWCKTFKWNNKEFICLATTAIKVDNKLLLESCLALGAPLNYQDEQLQNYLHLAVLANQAELVQWLLEQGVNSTSVDSQQRTALRLALEKNQEAMLPYLVKPEIIEQKDKNGFTALLYAVQQQSLNTVERLLNAGADIKATDEKGNTALHLAALFGNQAVVEKLLATAIETKRANQSGQTPAQVAYQAGYPELGKLIEYKHRERKFMPYMVPLQEQIKQQAQIIQTLSKQYEALFRQVNGHQDQSGATQAQTSPRLFNS